MTTALVFWLSAATLPVPNFSPAATAQTSVPNPRRTEATRLLRQGIAQFEASQFSAALSSLHRALTIYQALNLPYGQGNTLLRLGATYEILGQYAEALAAYQQAEQFFSKLDYPPSHAGSLNGIALIYLRTGQYSKSIEFYQRSLQVLPAAPIPLNGLGLAYQLLGDNERSLQFLQQALEAYRAMPVRSPATRLSQPERAAQILESRNGEATVLRNIGAIYQHRKQYNQALQSYQRSLQLFEQTGNRTGQQRSLIGIGNVYNLLNDSAAAMLFFQKALGLSQDLNDRRGQGLAWNGIGHTQAALKQYPEALESFQKALLIRRQIGDRQGEGNTLSHMGDVFIQQSQPNLAIVFLKQSVNVYESIRQGLVTLPNEQQQFYTETVADTYRQLADLLLQQDRVLEAQQVLDLLKIQELENYLRDVRGDVPTTRGVENLPREQQLWNLYQVPLERLVELGQELTQLKRIPVETRTPAQEQRRRQLEAEEREVLRVFLNFINNNPEVTNFVQQFERNGESVNLASLRSLQDDLRNRFGENAVLLYPLVLEDRTELVLVTPDTPPLRQVVSVGRVELNHKIREFREALQTRSPNAMPLAQQLYDWLIRPIAPALKQAGAETIIYLPDGQLRYIPLAALHSGERWLIEDFRVNNITALSLPNLSQTPGSLRILAGAFGSEQVDVTVSNRRFSFSGLPAAKREVELLASVIPQTTALYDQSFSPEEVRDRLSDYSVLHLATHAAVVPGSPEDSFILFNNQATQTIRDIQLWNLTEIDLVVLSACETGLGGNLGDGREILGLAYQMQRAGARAAIASLWQVSDTGTQALMNAFYDELRTENSTKSEALRQAQIQLIRGQLTASLEAKASIRVESSAGQAGGGGDSPPENSNSRFSHPYYWAPFILIGNGL